MKKDIIFPIGAAILLLLTFSSCGSSGQISSADASRLVMNLGSGTSYDINDYFHKIVLMKHFYELENSRFAGPSMYYETRWKYRSPFPDEYDEGIENVRTRVIVEARARTHSGLEASELYRIIYRGERQVMLMGEKEWEHLELSESALRELREIGRELEAELRTGVRRF